MRLFLSSHGLGRHGRRLAELTGGGGRALLVANALDAVPEESRRAVFVRTAAALDEIGFDVAELDLRRYFTWSEGLAAKAAGADLLFVTGGNAFTLRTALRESGFDETIRGLVGADALVYGGYSAGAVITGPTLRGIEHVDSADPADAIPEGYPTTIAWDGLGLVEYMVVPHYRSGHPESEAVERVLRHCREHDVPHLPLRDGEAVVVTPEGEELLRA